MLVFEIPPSQVPGGLNNTAGYGLIAPFMNSMCACHWVDLVVQLEVTTPCQPERPPPAVLLLQTRTTPSVFKWALTPCEKCGVALQDEGVPGSYPTLSVQARIRHSAGQHQHHPARRLYVQHLHQRERRGPGLRHERRFPVRGSGLRGVLPACVRGMRLPRHAYTFPVQPEHGRQDRHKLAHAGSCRGGSVVHLLRLLHLRVRPVASLQTALLPDLTYLGAALSLVSTNVGHIDIGLLQSLVDLVFTDIAMPLANKLLAVRATSSCSSERPAPHPTPTHLTHTRAPQNGLPLPSSAGLNLTNTSLLVENGYLTIASDFVVA